jgi:hypothetical protein
MPPLFTSYFQQSRNSVSLNTGKQVFLLYSLYLLPFNYALIICQAILLN